MDPIIAPGEGQATADGMGDLMLEPGMLRELKIGQDVKFAQPTTTTQVDPILMQNLMAMAVGTGVTYDQITGDLRGANYSSCAPGRSTFDSSSNRCKST